MQEIGNLFLCVNFLVQNCKRKDVRTAVNNSAVREKKNLYAALITAALALGNLGTYVVQA